MSIARRKYIDNTIPVAEFHDFCKNVADKARAAGAVLFALHLEAIEHVPNYEKWKMWHRYKDCDLKDTPPGVAADLFKSMPCPFPGALDYRLTNAEEARLALQISQRKRTPFGVRNPEDALQLHAWALSMLESEKTVLLGLAALSGRRSIDLCSADFSDAGFVNEMGYYARIANYKKERATVKIPYSFPLLCSWERWSAALTLFRKVNPCARAINKIANKIIRKEELLSKFTEDATLHCLRKLYVALLPFAFAPKTVSDAEFAKIALHHRGTPAFVKYMPKVARNRSDCVLRDEILK